MVSIRTGILYRHYLRVLAGSIPAELGDLSSIQRMTVDKNKLDGASNDLKSIIVDV